MRRNIVLPKQTLATCSFIVEVLALLLVIEQIQLPKLQTLFCTYLRVINNTQCFKVWEIWLTNSEFHWFFWYICLKLEFSVGTTYVHLLEENGHGAGVTCDTLGYHSILTETECIDAAKQMRLTQSYHVGGEPACDGQNPNHCFIDTAHKLIYFNRADCPVHQGNTQPSDGLICRKWGRL